MVLFDGFQKAPYSELAMKKITTLLKRRSRAMPKKIQFEWELPDALVHELDHDSAKLAETIKAAAVLDWVRTHKLSLRRGAELLQMPYRAFLELMTAHRVPSIDYDAGWLDKEMHLFEEGSEPTPA
jgi:predicted HTH domain antitoxin